MSEKFTFLKLAEKVILEEKKPLTGRQIWEISKTKGYDKLLTTKGMTPGNTIHVAILRDDIRVKNNSSRFIQVSSRPTRFFLRDLVSDTIELEKIKKRAEKETDELVRTKYSERDLHPLLTYYADRYLRILTKTIQHEKSSKKTHSQWLHPDLVGVYFPEWTDEVFEFSNATGSQSISLYSFEMKKELRFSNIRESFFQAVSNSSWGNEGYLVAAEIAEEDDFTSELKRLSTSFGIGIIKLDTEDPDSSELVFPAKNKPELDWETINKIASLNTDFRDFIKRIKNDLLSKEIRKERYDKILAVEKLKEKFMKLK